MTCSSTINMEGMFCVSSFCTLGDIGRSFIICVTCGESIGIVFTYLLSSSSVERVQVKNSASLWIARICSSLKVRNGKAEARFVRFSAIICVNIVAIFIADVTSIFMLCKKILRVHDIRSALILWCRLCGIRNVRLLPQCTIRQLHVVTRFFSGFLYTFTLVPGVVSGVTLQSKVPLI